MSSLFPSLCVSRQPRKNVFPERCLPRPGQIPPAGVCRAGLVCGHQGAASSGPERGLLLSDVGLSSGAG